MPHRLDAQRHVERRAATSVDDAAALAARPLDLKLSRWESAGKEDLIMSQ